MNGNDLIQIIIAFSAFQFGVVFERYRYHKDIKKKDIYNHNVSCRVVGCTFLVRSNNLSAVEEVMMKHMEICHPYGVSAE